MKQQQLEKIKRRFGVIGHNNDLNRAISIAMQVAPTHMNVLIQGENGTGKESFSKIIHFLSNQKHKKLIAINCGAIPEGTIDSELFGHAKGAFTGAIESRKGYFEEANEGTIFLDEIGEMPLSTQARLLRTLEYGEFIKVGSSEVQKTNARIIAATNVNLVQAVHKGRFREDLYYRINTVPIHIPPLRKRKDDILLLFKKFAGDFADTHHTQPIQLTPEAQKHLIAYTFPGNIRQLKNIVTQISALEYQTPTISLKTLSSYLPKENRALITLQQEQTQEKPPISERELLYKVLFDIQKDLYDLKRLVFEQLKKDRMGDKIINAYPALFSRQIAPPSPTPSLTEIQKLETPKEESYTKEIPVSTINEEKTPQKKENLLLKDKKKELIRKALEQHNYKRKLAAKSLGISERTIYRMIKEYNL